MVRWCSGRGACSFFDVEFDLSSGVDRCLRTTGGVSILSESISILLQLSRRSGELDIDLRLLASAAVVALVTNGRI